MAGAVTRSPPFLLFPLLQATFRVCPTLTSYATANDTVSSDVLAR